MDFPYLESRPVESEFSLVLRASPSGLRGRWRTRGSTGGQDQQGGWVGQKEVPSVRVCVGGASVTDRRPYAV